MEIVIEFSLQRPHLCYVCGFPATRSSAREPHGVPRGQGAGHRCCRDQCSGLCSMVSLRAALPVGTVRDGRRAVWLHRPVQRPPATCTAEPSKRSSCSRGTGRFTVFHFHSFQFPSLHMARGAHRTAPPPVTSPILAGPGQGAALLTNLPLQKDSRARRMPSSTSWGERVSSVFLTRHTLRGQPLFGAPWCRHTWSFCETREGKGLLHLGGEYLLESSVSMMVTTGNRPACIPFLH